MTGLLRAEALKLWTHPLSVIALAGVVVGVPGLTTLLAGAVGSDQPFSIVLRALAFGQIFVVLLGAGAFGQEYEDSTLRTSLLAVPGRSRLFTAKLLTLAGHVVAGFVVACLVSTPVAGLITGSWPGWDLGRTLGGLLSWIALAVLAGAVAVVARSAMVPASILIPLLLGLSQIFLAFIPVARFLPDLATIRVFIPTVSANYLAPVAGLLIQWAWAAPALVAAGWAFHRRDVG